MGTAALTLGRGRVRTATVTRPANTTTYAAGDVVGSSTAADNTLVLTSVNLNGNGFSTIQKAILHSSASVSTKPDIDLLLFHTTFTTQADNAAFAPSDTEMGYLVGVINFATGGWTIGNATSGAGGNAACVVKDIQLPVTTASGSNGNLFGIMVARNAYAPVSGEIFTLRLGVVD